MERERTPSWPVLRGALGAAALLGAASAPAAADPKALWGAPAPLPGEACDAPAPVDAMRDGERIALRGRDGPLRAVRVAAPPAGAVVRVATICLVVPLANDLLLGGRSVAVTIVYHGTRRIGWGGAMVSARVNGGAIAYDRLGGGDGPNELRLRVAADAVIAARGVRLMVRVGAQARRGGRLHATIDAVRIEPA